MGIKKHIINKIHTLNNDICVMKKKYSKLGQIDMLSNEGESLKKKIETKKGELTAYSDILEKKNKVNNITPEILLSLGFKEHTTEDNKSYYTYNDQNGDIILITNTSKDVINDCFSVRYYNNVNIGNITNKNDLKKLIKLVEKFKYYN